MSTEKIIDVSIVIPVYNGGDVLGPMIEKILRENRISLQLIVVNDGSTDNTAEVLNTFNDPRLTVIHQENQGVYAARNAGIAARRGDWLILLDADDDFTDDMIFERFREANRHDVDVYIANGWRNKLYDGYNIHRRQPYNQVISGFSWINHVVSVREWPHYLWLQIVRSEYINQLQLNFQLGSSHKDILWTTELGLGNGRFYISDKSDYVYCDNQNSITHSKKYFDSRTISYIGVISQLIYWANEACYRDVEQALRIHAVEETRHFFGMYRKKTKNKPYAMAQFRQQVRFADLLKGANSGRKLWFLLRLYIELAKP